MIYLDSYEITFTINDIELTDLNPASISFVMEDSIHNLFPTASIKLDDSGGYIQELLSLSEGSKIKLNYGYRDNAIENTYGVNYDELLTLTSNNTLSGELDIDCIHEFFFKQEITSQAHTKRISDIVSEISAKYPFKNVNVSGTGNNETWLQPLMTDAQFIEKILLPNSFSNNANHSPFFAFTTSDNVFNYKNYRGMYSVNPVIELTYKAGSAETFSPNLILDVKRLKTGAVLHRPLNRRKLFKLDNSGNYEEDTDNFNSYPDNTKKVQIVDTDSDTGYFVLGDYETGTATTERYEANAVYSMMDSFFLERFIVDCPLNVGLKAGDTVTLSFPILKQDGSALENSKLYTDKYLIESSRHIWDGSTQQSKTTLVCSRKNVPNVSEYYLHSELI